VLWVLRRAHPGILSTSTPAVNVQLNSRADTNVEHSDTRDRRRVDTSAHQRAVDDRTHERHTAVVVIVVVAHVVIGLDNNREQCHAPRDLHV
jgi:hypothetical protein